MDGLPLEKPAAEICELTLEDMKGAEKPLLLLVKYPLKSQWVHNESWQWLQYKLALSQGNEYQKSGDIKAFTKETAYSIAQK